MTWLEACLLGLLQGLTEFLPVSSSGHLVLGQYVLGIESPHAGDVTFEVFVHFGTAMSIATVYWRRLGTITTRTFGAVLRPGMLTEQWKTGEARLGSLILLTLVPTGLVYVLFKDALEAAFDSPPLVCAMLLVTGVLLLLTLMRKDPSGEISPIKALVIGIAQAAAIIPGISRSGATICAALYQNVEPEKAADFSFLILLPVVLGATLLKSLDMHGDVPWQALLAGATVAYLSGMVAIRLVLGIVRRGRIHWFAYYCLALGTIGLFYLQP